MRIKVGCQGPGLLLGIKGNVQEGGGQLFGGKYPECNGLDEQTIADDIASPSVAAAGRSVTR